MQYSIYAVRDLVAGQYHFPFYANNDEHAKRMFSQMLEREESMARHPEDYACEHLGYWDNTTGEYDTVEPTHIARGSKRHQNGEATNGDA